MATVYLKGEVCHTYGNLPKVGEMAPRFELVVSDMKDITNLDFEGKRVVLNIFPSLDTEVCAMSVRRFNSDMAKLYDTVVICVSMDLPFAAHRFCVANDIDNVVVASAFRSPAFGEEYGVKLIDGPLEGLLARSVVVIGVEEKVIYTELVKEITHEPQYDGVLERLCY